MSEQVVRSAHAVRLASGTSGTAFPDRLPAAPKLLDPVKQARAEQRKQVLDAIATSRQAGSLRLRAVYDALVAAATRGEPCPTNWQLAEITLGERDRAMRAVGELERLGLIRVTRYAKARVVEIVATHARTAPPARGRSGGEPLVREVRA